jgi:cytochrome oxidase Cu insertion factor (SCO1/SenC/PrrC family)
LTIRIAVALAMAVLALTPLTRAQEPSVGARISGFTLRDLDGRLQNFPSLKGQVTVVIFFSTRCPMSNAFNYRRNQLYREFGNGVRFLVIDSNVNESPAEVKTYAKDVGFDFPVYEDVDAAAANIMGARNTTETFVLDQQGIVRYRGYIEDAPNPARTTRQGLRMAIEEVLAGQPVVFADTRGIVAPFVARICPRRRCDRTGLTNLHQPLFPSEGQSPACCRNSFCLHA